MQAPSVPDLPRTASTIVALNAGAPMRARLYRPTQRSCESPQRLFLGQHKSTYATAPGKPKSPVHHPDQAPARARCSRCRGIGFSPSWVPRLKHRPVEKRNGMETCVQHRLHAQTLPYFGQDSSAIHVLGRVHKEYSCAANSEHQPPTNRTLHQAPAAVQTGGHNGHQGSRCRPPISRVAPLRRTPQLSGSSHPSSDW